MLFTMFSALPATTCMYMPHVSGTMYSALPASKCMCMCMCLALCSVHCLRANDTLLHVHAYVLLLMRHVKCMRMTRHC